MTINLLKSDKNLLLKKIGVCFNPEKSYQMEDKNDTENSSQ